MPSMKRCLTVSLIWAVCLVRLLIRVEHGKGGQYRNAVRVFGRRQAYESLRGTNPRAADDGLWILLFLAEPGEVTNGNWETRDGMRSVWIVAGGDSRGALEASLTHGWRGHGRGRDGVLRPGTVAGRAGSRRISRGWWRAVRGWAGLAPALERLDDDDVPTTAWARGRTSSGSSGRPSFS
jgi:hypothetical protein